MVDTAVPTSTTGTPVAPAPLDTRRVVGATAVLVALTATLVVLAGWHLTQGTSRVGVGDLLDLLPGREGQDAARDVLVGSRLPRLAAGLAVGFALGVAGALFQSVARNALASPDTLAVTAGAFLAVTLVTAFGLSLPLWASGATAFVGGLAAAALVMGLAGGLGTSTTRLVLAGSAVALALSAATAMLLILFDEETTGLFAWGSGSLSQLGLRAFQQAGPLIALATVGAVLLSRRLDLLGLGDEAASVLGVPVRSTRFAGVVVAVLLTASAVTLAGPIGFVGLAAPAIVRLLGVLVPGLLRHVVLLPAAGLMGAVVVVGADATVRAVIGPEEALAVPTGVATTLLGALVLVLLARRLRDSGPTRQPAGTGMGSRSRRRFLVTVTVVGVATVGVVLLGLLAGYTWLKIGDLSLWFGGDAPAFVSFALDERAPRVAAAVLAGGGLALAGTLVQATCRNPLAEPGILGITGGAGVGAVLVVTSDHNSTTAMLLAATAGALVTFGLVYALAWRNGLDSDRLVLVGIGVSAGATALTTYLLVRSNPFDTPRVFTWLSGTTYGRSWSQVVPVLVVLLVVLPLAWLLRRELDLLALDEDTPRLAGLPLERTRLVVLGVSALLSAACVSAVGVVGFVGLVAPHAARALVGGRHARVLPVAVMLGAVLLGLADALGRTVIAPAQVPAGLVVALLGAPYFVYLLARSRA
ncbi:iron ABC transporter permease [Nocardioides dongxiaopingii]|uniref:iron ABC transporter permease n=1 Tax=Nocardioides dongxiaopingii TaxID=2576036 RepID=UPI0010C76927|nr:iron ABC transporter permease [Nocardioides dongxiaopingii]